MNRKVLTARFGNTAQYTFKVGRSHDSTGHGRDLARRSSDQRVAQASDGQAFAAFGPACVDDGTATTGFHANQKAMGACTANFGGLVGAFHDLLDSV